MDEMEQAHHELNRIQEIIARHEGHMFSLRGWLFAALAGVLAAYYSNALELTLVKLLVVITALIFASVYAELRHVILVDAVVTRSGEVERKIADARSKASDANPRPGWYDGPKVHETCGKAVKKMIPQLGMTLVLNMFFYLALGGAVVSLVYFLPRR